jgi:hypothetical protein
MKISNRYHYFYDKISFKPRIEIFNEPFPAFVGSIINRLVLFIKILSGKSAKQTAVGSNA